LLPKQHSAVKARRSAFLFRGNPNMTVPALHLTAAQRSQIASAAEASYPHECCGILFGTDTPAGRLVDELQPVPNTAPEDQRHRRFAIDPAMLIAAEKKCGPPRVVLGFYHSHPDHPAVPSEHDRAHAWPFYSYVIVSVRHRNAADLTSWTLDETAGQFQPQPIVTR
jgi:proteasome lid subunit RPN8/RPN11